MSVREAALCHTVEDKFGRADVEYSVAKDSDFVKKKVALELRKVQDDDEKACGK